MAKITIFIFILLAIFINMLFYKFGYDNINTQNNMPNLVFENAMMYKINEKEVISIIKVKKAMNYKDKKILYGGAFYTRLSNDKINSFIGADLIVQEHKIIKFKTNVIYSTDDDLLFNTQELVYDKNKQIAFNKTSFTAKDKKNRFRGNNLYIDYKNGIIKAKNVEFIYAD